MGNHLDIDSRVRDIIARALHVPEAYWVSVLWRGAEIQERRPVYFVEEMRCHFNANEILWESLPDGVVPDSMALSRSRTGRPLLYGPLLVDGEFRHGTGIVIFVGSIRVVGSLP